jgi:hypothetical protein
MEIGDSSVTCCQSAYQYGVFSGGVDILWLLIEYKFNFKKPHFFNF